jgi:hypothetical protein
LGFAARIKIFLTKVLLFIQKFGTGMIARSCSFFNQQSTKSGRRAKNFTALGMMTLKGRVSNSC